MIRLFISFLLLTQNAFAFDHGHKEFTKLLTNNTKKVGNQVFVNYAQIKKHPEQLLAYLEQLQAVSEEKFKKFSKKEQLAFWINAYNAYTIQIVIKNYPIKSIKNIGSFFSSVWSQDFISLMGKKISLDDIEHETIRKQFKEPRIHFAVNCASMGCPSLLQEAFVSFRLDDQLDEAAANFLNNKAKNYYNKKEKTLYLSKIFKWYGADFNAKYGGYMNYLVKQKLAPKSAAIEWLNYDWDLNEYKQ